MAGTRRSGLWKWCLICILGVLGAGGMLTAAGWLFGKTPDSFANAQLDSEPVGGDQPLAGGPVPTNPADPQSLKDVDSKVEDPTEIRVSIGKTMIDGLPESLTVHAGPNDYRLHCTGHFIRTRALLFVPIDLYAIANYVDSPAAESPEAALDGLLVDGKAKVYLLRFLKNLSGTQILNAIQEEVDATFTDVDMLKNGADVRRFVQKFSKGSNRGDVVYLCWLPGNRIFCSFNDPNRLELISKDSSLTRAIWRIWCGEGAGPERMRLVERIGASQTHR